MIRKTLVNTCLADAREWSSNGPWLLIVFDQNYLVVEQQVFFPDEEDVARPWALDLLQEFDRCLGLHANPMVQVMIGDAQ